jgi:hypothetical protein
MDLNVHFRVHNSPPFDPIARPMNLVNIHSIFLVTVLDERLVLEFSVLITSFHI